MSDNEAFLTHANRARLVAERGHAIFWDIAESLRQGAKELFELGETEDAEATLKAQQDLADWWTDNCEVIDSLVHDYVELTRKGAD